MPTLCGAIARGKADSRAAHHGYFGAAQAARAVQQRRCSMDFFPAVERLFELKIRGLHPHPRLRPPSAFKAPELDWGIRV